MKIINIGVLAHVDAGKTTLTESLLYNSGAITELGSVDKGTTRTDNTLLERQRGITIQTGITSFQWENTKVNIIDTPGHMDFLAEVYRSLSVLDGAILLISAKDGVQAQTRILFHALRKMGIPTIFFINKIDQNGIDLSTVYQDIKEKLSAEIVIKQKVELYPNMCVTNFTESEQWDTVIEGNDDLLEISDSDPLLQYYVDSTTHEIILSFLGKVQMEVTCALLQEKYHVEVKIKKPTVIYMERPLKKAEYTIHIEVPPNPFWASIGLSVAPLPLGSGVQYESSVSLGYLNQSFQNAVMEGIRYGCEQGLYGWNVTDCKICFKYGLYYSPVSTPADFRMLAPIVLEQVLKKAGTELLEPYLSFKIYAPQEYLSRAYNDAPKYCANIVNTQLKNNEVILSGEIPARCIQEYRNDLTFFTNGRSVCLTELKGYYVTTGESVCQPRRPNSRIDKVRYMFNKIT